MRSAALLLVSALSRTPGGQARALTAGAVDASCSALTKTMFQARVGHEETGCWACSVLAMRAAKALAVATAGPNARGARVQARSEDFEADLLCLQCAGLVPSCPCREKSCCRAVRLRMLGHALMTLFADAQEEHLAVQCKLIVELLARGPPPDVARWYIRYALRRGIASALPPRRALALLARCGALRAVASAARADADGSGARAEAANLVAALMRATAAAGDAGFGALLRAADGADDLARALCSAQTVPPTGGARRGKGRREAVRSASPGSSGVEGVVAPAARTKPQSRRDQPCYYEGIGLYDDVSADEGNAELAAANMREALLALTRTDDPAAALARAADDAAARLLAELELERRAGVPKQKHAKQPSGEEAPTPAKGKAKKHRKKKKPQAQGDDHGAAGADISIDGADADAEDEMEMSAAAMARALRCGVAAPPPKGVAASHATLEAPVPDASPAARPASSPPLSMAEIALSAAPKPVQPLLAVHVHTEATHEDEGLCIVCLDAPADTSLPGCDGAHAVVLCAPCAVRIVAVPAPARAGGACCPLCRAPASS